MLHTDYVRVGEKLVDFSKLTPKRQHRIMMKAARKATAAIVDYNAKEEEARRKIDLAKKHLESRLSAEYEKAVKVLYELAARMKAHRSAIGTMLKVPNITPMDKILGRILPNSLMKGRKIQTACLLPLRSKMIVSTKIENEIQEKARRVLQQRIAMKQIDTSVGTENDWFDEVLYEVRMSYIDEDNFSHYAIELGLSNIADNFLSSNRVRANLATFTDDFVTMLHMIYNPNHIEAITAIKNKIENYQKYADSQYYQEQIKLLQQQLDGLYNSALTKKIPNLEMVGDEYIFTAGEHIKLVINYVVREIKFVITFSKLEAKAVAAEYGRSAKTTRAPGERLYILQDATINWALSGGELRTSLTKIIKEKYKDAYDQKPLKLTDGRLIYGIFRDNRKEYLAVTGRGGKFINRIILTDYEDGFIEYTNSDGELQIIKVAGASSQIFDIDVVKYLSLQIKDRAHDFADIFRNVGYMGNYISNNGTTTWASYATNTNFRHLVNTTVELLLNNLDTGKVNPNRALRALGYLILVQGTAVEETEDGKLINGYEKYKTIVAKRREALDVSNLTPDNAPIVPNTNPEIESMPHQAYGAAVLDRNEAVPIDVKAGGGKTIIYTLDMLNLLNKGEIHRPLLIVPQSTLYSTIREINWITSGTVNFWVFSSDTVDKGPGQGEDEMYEKAKTLPPNTILISTYSWLIRNSTSIVRPRINRSAGGNKTIKFIQVNIYPRVQKFINEVGIDYVCMDESHRARNINTNTADAISAFAGVKYRRVATGTMAVNKPSDIVAQMRIINPAIFGSKFEFDQNYTVNGAGTDYTEEARDQIRDQILGAGGLQVPRAAWIYLLPKLKRNYHYPKLPPALQTIYKRIVDVFRSELENDPRLAKIRNELNRAVASNTMADLMKVDDFDGEDKTEAALIARMHRIDSFPSAPTADAFGKILNEFLATVEGQELPENIKRAYLQIKADLEAMDSADTRSPKLDTIKEILDGHFADPKNKKVIIFAQWGVVVDYIYDNLDPKYKPMAIKFSTKKGKGSAIRDEIMKKFEFNDDIKIIVAMEGSLREGLNLQHANRIIHLTCPWNPGDLEQMIARIWRPAKRGDIKQVQEVANSIAYWDFIITDETAEVTKMGRMIAKMYNNNRISSTYTPPPFGHATFGTSNLRSIFVTNKLLPDSIRQVNIGGVWNPDIGSFSGGINYDSSFWVQTTETGETVGDELNYLAWREKAYNDPLISKANQVNIVWGQIDIERLKVFKMSLDNMLGEFNTVDVFEPYRRLMDDMYNHEYTEAKDTWEKKYGRDAYPRTSKELIEGSKGVKSIVPPEVDEQLDFNLDIIDVEPSSSAKIIEQKPLEKTRDKGETVERVAIKQDTTWLVRQVEDKLPPIAYNIATEEGFRRQIQNLMSNRSYLRSKLAKLDLRKKNDKAASKEYHKKIEHLSIQIDNLRERLNNMKKPTAKTSTPKISPEIPSSKAKIADKLEDLRKRRMTLYNRRAYLQRQSTNTKEEKKELRLIEQTLEEFRVQLKELRNALNNKVASRVSARPVLLTEEREPVASKKAELKPTKQQLVEKEEEPIVEVESEPINIYTGFIGNAFSIVSLDSADNDLLEEAGFTKMPTMLYRKFSTQNQVLKVLGVLASKYNIVNWEILKLILKTSRFSASEIKEITRVNKKSASSKTSLWVDFLRVGTTYYVIVWKNERLAATTSSFLIKNQFIVKNNPGTWDKVKLSEYRDYVNYLDYIGLQVGVTVTNEDDFIEEQKRILIVSNPLNTLKKELRQTWKQVVND